MMNQTITAFSMQARNSGKVFGGEIVCVGVEQRVRDAIAGESRCLCVQI